MSLSSWHEKGRPALFEALAAVCDKIDEDIEAEFKDKASICQHNLKPGELEALRTRAADAARLEQDNRRLREALSKLEKDRSKRASPPQASTTTDATSQGTSASGPIAGEPAAAARNENVKKLQLLEESYRVLKSSFQTAKASLNKRKIERDQWIAYSKELEKKIQNLKAKSKSKTAVSAPKDADKIRENEPIAIPSTSFISESDGVTNADEVFCSRPVATTEPPPHPVDEERICDSQPPPDSTVQPTASNATSQELPALALTDEPLAPVLVKSEPASDDSIAIVDERQIRKRPLEDTETEQPRAVTRIKEEHCLDTPIVDASGSSPHDSMDLSNAGPKFQTPRRSRIREDVACSLNVEIFSSQTSAIPDSPTHAAAETRQCVSAWNQNGATEAQGPAVDRPLSRPAQKQPAVSPMRDRHVDQRQAAVHRPGTTRDPGDGGVEVAQPTQSDDGSSIQASNDENRPPSYDLNQQLAGPQINRKMEQKRHSLDQVHSLTDLDVPQPRQLPFDNATRNPRRDLNRSFHEEPSVAASKQVPERIQSPNTSLAGFPRENTGRANPRGGVLRTKGPNELSLDDFKINPKFNNGYSYAYSEVVRGRAERAALPGCTDTSCCGQDFRVLARAAWGILPRTAEQRYESKIYLEQYLGDNAARLFGMTREEMDELWIEAKAKELADRWGKHRHRFARAKSPPGFWNADFPSTQEVQAERNEAEKRRAEEVQARYKEAMRPDGRWLFRDE